MHVITRKRLNEFAALHPNTRSDLAQWYRIVKENNFSNFAELRQLIPSADQVGKLTVFNIGAIKPGWLQLFTTTEAKFISELY